MTRMRATTAFLALAFLLFAVPATATVAPEAPEQEIPPTPEEEVPALPEPVQSHVDDVAAAVTQELGMSQDDPLAPLQGLEDAVDPVAVLQTEFAYPLEPAEEDATPPAEPAP